MKASEKMLQRAVGHEDRGNARLIQPLTNRL
jgi:hypothetical protein